MDRLLELLSKKKSKSLTPEEQVELSGLLSSESARAFSGVIDELFEIPSELQSMKEEEVNLAINRIVDRITATSPNGRRGARRIQFWKIAAAAVVFVAIGWSYFFFQNRESKAVSASIIQTRKGSKSFTTLPDGTKVWINSDTKLTYEKSFGSKNREVMLEGEAYFDVVSDKERPFIVHTREMSIKVKGTIFNVRAYADEVNAQATLVEGLIEVQLTNKNDARILLKPNEKVIVKQHTADEALPKLATSPELTIVAVKPSGADTAFMETQWIDNHLAFEDQNLSQIIPVLERWYDVEIVVDKKLTTGRLFNGVFESDNLDDVMRTLGLTLGFHYKIDKDKIYIY